MTDPDPANYLGSSAIIDLGDTQVQSLALSLATGDKTETARRCFEFVRDQIRHSSDYQLNPVTCNASDVLKHATGYCYAKSHLLAALLRANGIPAGFCYQRLAVDESLPRYCLHGLNAIYLEQQGWYRVDARGNRDGIDAQFDPPHEQLAFSTKSPGERDLPGIFVDPLPEVVEALGQHTDWKELYENLPDAGE